jgi:hypothetical protein
MKYLCALAAQLLHACPDRRKIVSSDVVGSHFLHFLESGLGAICRVLYKFESHRPRQQLEKWGGLPCRFCQNLAHLAVTGLGQDETAG